MSLATFNHYCLSKSLTWICPSCHFPSFINNGINSCCFTEKSINSSLAHDYNSDDSDTSIIREGSSKPAPNATSTPACNNKNIKSIKKNSKLCALIAIA